MQSPVQSNDPDRYEPDEEDSASFGDLFRDFLAFELKLFLDGLKDIVLAQGAVVALVVGFFSRRRRGRAFYGLMRIGTRFEEWLGLYRPLDEDTEEAPFGGANRALREAERRIRERKAKRDPEAEE